ncbi:response regulator [Ferruginibacter sp. SUN106]|uniref:response regulator n=1 Tax=Ferruginibacter sp. SUN106 TaxID=2978348 RepID=UPI003D36E33B
MQIGIVVYEDNNNLRESLCNLITFSKDLLLLGNYARVEEVITQIEELQPDVILMDIDMPGMNGIEAVKQIRTFNQQVQVIMLTVFDDNRHVLDAICAGASGYLLKKHISDHLLDAITQVLQGEAPMSPGIARMVIQSMQQNSKPVNNNYNLTQREKEILSNLSKGNSYKLIAADLSISIDTVRTHIKNIYEKLQVHTQTEAVSKAVNERLV